MNAKTLSALRAYRAECRKLFDGRGSKALACQAHSDLSAAFYADNARAEYGGFADFLACNDALPWAEMRVELA